MWLLTLPKHCWKVVNGNELNKQQISQTCSRLLELIIVHQDVFPQ